MEDAGYSTVIQAWDFLAGDNFVLKMQEAATQSNRNVTVLSPNYLTALIYSTGMVPRQLDSPVDSLERLNAAAKSCLQSLKEQKPDLIDAIKSIAGKVFGWLVLLAVDRDQVKCSQYQFDPWRKGVEVKLPLETEAVTEVVVSSKRGSWPETVHVFDDASAQALRAAEAAGRPLLIRGALGGSGRKSHEIPFFYDSGQHAEHGAASPIGGAKPGILRKP